MSIEAYKAVWKRTRQNSGALNVLLAIADCTNSEGTASLAMSTLADKVGMTKRNAQRCVRALEEAGELEVRRNQGRRGSNIYRILLNEPKNGDAHVTGDAGVAKAVSPASSTGDVSVIQSVNKPLKESTPIVPTGDEVEFWIQFCFKCFGQATRPVSLRVRRAIMMALPHLNKKHVSSLLQFYSDEPVNSKKPRYSSRRHSPEGLMRDLLRQLAIGAQECPPPAPPKEYPFSLEEACQYLRQKYPSCRLPRSLAELHSLDWHVDIRNEIYEAMRRKKETRRTNDVS